MQKYKLNRGKKLKPKKSKRFLSLSRRTNCMQKKAWRNRTLHCKSFPHSEEHNVVFSGDKTLQQQHQGKVFLCRLLTSTFSRISPSATPAQVPVQLHRESAEEEKNYFNKPYKIIVALF